MRWYRSAEVAPVAGAEAIIAIREKERHSDLQGTSPETKKKEDKIKRWYPESHGSIHR